MGFTRQSACTSALQDHELLDKISYALPTAERLVILSQFYDYPYNPSNKISNSRQNIMAAFEIMKPKPSPYPLVRIGGESDGAYLVPDDLVGISACFSPGVNNRKEFEDQLTNEYNIMSHMCDYTSDPTQFRTPLILGKQTFR
jgi:hypothetical protein